ncbi:MAG: TetR family transcriptional regulator [Deltaproteobacteria bacterium]|nr:TetR family transcriptional regulator [Deltaproteobacteria bacterium]
MKKHGSERNRGIEPTKNRIMDAAQMLFAKKGFDATRVQEIADIAEVNKAMIYYYFKDKDALLYAVVERIIKGIKDAIPRYLEEEDNTIDGLETFLDFYIEYLAQNSSFVRLMAWEILSGKHIQSLAMDYFMPMFFLMREKIAKGVDSGQIRPVSPEHTIFSIVGMNVFYTIALPLIQILLGGDPLSAEMLSKRKEEVKAFVMKGLLPFEDRRRI